MSMEQAKEGNKEQAGQILQELQVLVRLSWGRTHFAKPGERAFID